MTTERKPPTREQTIRSLRYPSNRDDRAASLGMYREYDAHEYLCATVSDDLNWITFGLEVSDLPCDDIDGCIECWPLCAYCWFTCDPDGTCDRQGGGDDCPTLEPWAQFAKPAGPPWFTAPYDELREAINNTPWRPPPLITCKPPYLPSRYDKNLYHPYALEALNLASIESIWRHTQFITLQPRP